MSNSWTDNLLTSDTTILALLRSIQRIAVLGIRSEQYSDRPAHYVPAALLGAGLEIVPVPVVEPEVKSILGQTTYQKLADIPGEIDLINVFRKASDIPAHLPDILSKKPRAVWFQSGIEHAAAAETLARAGILVVQNRCLMVDYRQVRCK